MSFDHKAFAFAWDSFRVELAPTLQAALLADESAELERFVDANVASCSNPYGGGSLSTAWRELIEKGDTQEIADFALTKYYDPSADHGLGQTWAALEEELDEATRGALLGAPFAVESGALFNPGRMGSYFQTPEDVRRSVATLRERPVVGLEGFLGFLETLVVTKQGVYVTF